MLFIWSVDVSYSSFQFSILQAVVSSDLAIITTLCSSDVWVPKITTLKHEIVYCNTSPNSRATIRWIGVGESKNVTLISHPTPNSNALPDSTCGGSNPLASCRWYGVTIVSIHENNFMGQNVPLRDSPYSHETIRRGITLWHSNMRCCASTI